MKIAIIQFPGSNCEAESLRAVRQAGMEAEEFMWNRNPRELAHFDGYFIVGGFSYEDRSRAGVIGTLDPLMKHIRQEAEKGKPVLGVCNGAQILVETGMVPGLRGYEIGMGLAINKRVAREQVLGTGFYNNWVHIKLDAPSGGTAFTRHFKQGEIIKIPVAHGEGRFVMEQELLKEMILNNQTVFRYCDENGRMSEDFPVNPNGSLYNLAAVCNSAGNVLAIMPHPERTKDGQPIFTSMREYIVKSKSVEVKAKKFLEYTPKPYITQTYHSPQHSLQFIIELIITDNEAVTVENTLRQHGIPADIKRYTHWEIEFTEGTDKESIMQKIMESGELFNANKERSVTSPLTNGSPPYEGGVRGGRRMGGVQFLVRYRDDVIGQGKKETIEKRFDIAGIAKITRGNLWRIRAKDGKIEELQKQVLDTRILCNPFSQECYRYSGL